MSIQDSGCWLKNEGYYLDQNHRSPFGFLGNGGPYFSCEGNDSNFYFFTQIFAKKQVKIEFDLKDGQKKTIEGKVVTKTMGPTKYTFEFEGEKIPLQSKVTAVYLKVDYKPKIPYSFSDKG